MKCNSIAKSSLVLLSLLLTAAGAHAQSPARATVPFAFKVGTTQMPAGTYSISNDMSTNFICFRNVQTGNSVAALAKRESPSKRSNELIFHRYGSQYVLTDVLGSQGSQGLSLLAPKQQKQLEAAQIPVNTGNTIEIASK
jgi:hypothetical protein